MSITANGSNYDLVLDTAQGDGAGNGIAQGTSLTFQPVFITQDTDRRQYGLEALDTYSKIIYPQMWNSYICLLYTSPSPRDLSTSRMPSSA